MQTNHIEVADALTYLKGLPDESVHCMVSSPPYFEQRDYKVSGQLGRERTPAEYVNRLGGVFSEARRVLRSDGTLWLNLGDGFASKASHQLPEKSLLGIPWRVAFALQDSGWLLRTEIIWSKTNPMAESVKDRPTRSHEYVFLFTKCPRYWIDMRALREPAAESSKKRIEQKTFKDQKGGEKDYGRTGVNSSRSARKALENFAKNFDGFRNTRTVWEIPVKASSVAHDAVMPPELAERCILAGCPIGGVVLDMFIGAGTTARAAIKLNRNYIGCDLNPEYVEMARASLAAGVQVALL